MIDFYGVFLATCDEPKDKKCWKESIVRVEENEKKEEAEEFLKGLGWEFLADNYSLCPYCSKGITQKDAKAKVKLRLVEPDKQD